MKDARKWLHMYVVSKRRSLWATSKILAQGMVTGIVDGNIEVQAWCLMLLVANAIETSVGSRLLSSVMLLKFGI